MSAEPLRFLLWVFAGWANRRHLELIEYLKEENRVLREQLAGRPLRFTDVQRRRLAVKGRVLGRRVLDQVAGLVKPDTILRWYRELIAKKYDGSSRRRRGHPGARIQPGAKPGSVARSATWVTTSVATPSSASWWRKVWKPAPLRGKTMPWKVFLKAHFGAIAATDLFSVEVLTFTGLVRYMVLFVIDLESRRVHIAGIVRQPHGAWMNQIARNLTDAVDGFLRGKRYLIHERDPLFTHDFRHLLRAAGVRSLRLPPHSPNLNAYAERFVRSIKSECLSKLVPLG